MAINKRIWKIALANAGISQREFSRRINVSSAMVCMIVSGKSWSEKVEREMQSFIAIQFKKIQHASNETRIFKRFFPLEA